MVEDDGFSISKPECLHLLLILLLPQRSEGPGNPKKGCETFPWQINITHFALQGTVSPSASSFASCCVGLLPGRCFSSFAINTIASTTKRRPAIQTDHAKMRSFRFEHHFRVALLFVVEKWESTETFNILTK